MEDFDINPTLGLKAAVPADAAQKLRGSRFDRADFAARRPTMPQETAKQSLPPALQASRVASAEPTAALTATGPLTATAMSEQPADAAQVTEDHLRELGWSRAKIKKILGGPEPDDDSPDSNANDLTAQAEAHLLSLGWSKSDIARLLVGPKQSHLTAEALFRQHAANSAGDQEALLKALARAGAQRVKPDPSLLSGLDVAHLSPEEPTDLEQIISQFAALPDVQKQRFLLLLDSQKPSKKNSVPSRAGTSTPPTKTTKTSGGSPKSAGPAGDVLPVVKSSLDLLSTALKGLLGTGKDGSKKGPSGPGGRTKTSSEDEPDSDESSSQADDDTADEDQDDSMDDVPSTEEDTSSPSDPEEPIGAGNESEPD